MAQENRRSTISAKEAQRQFGKIIERAYVDRELEPARFERLCQGARLEAERAGVTEEQLEQQMEAIRARNHQKAYE